jgi:uncharacterized membrane protein
MGVSLTYITIYLPVALMAYLPHWYFLVCKLHPGCDFIGQSITKNWINELTGFFLHINQLAPGWSAKEKIHLLEVRNIFDIMGFMAIAAVILFVISFNKKNLSTAAFINMVVILSLIALLPFFKFFWIKIFHPLLFDNDLWRNKPFDRSYYLFPSVFFKYSAIFLIVVSSTINGFTWIISRKKKSVGTIGE